MHHDGLRPFAFVFITAYPRCKRPMYALPLPSDDSLTDSFDLLYHGLEVTTGGMRIHVYDSLCESMRSRGLDIAPFGPTEGSPSALRG